ncbi:MAG: hypothetical protein ACT4TC_12615 [Myxococcaceae bacterium]
MTVEGILLYESTRESYFVGIVSSLASVGAALLCIRGVRLIQERLDAARIL